jgi:hypothetical protein
MALAPGRRRCNAGRVLVGRPITGIWKIPSAPGRAFANGEKMSVTATALSVNVDVKLSRCRRTAVGVLEVRRWTRLLTGSWN